MKYEPIIGLEIHIQAKTKSKMFCRCDSDYFGSEPNSKVCPVCMGLPGALPVPNREGLNQCIRLSLALNCQINKNSKFDRKHYFYPDLPKGYQISQYDQPLGYKGFMEIDVDGDIRRIRITRVHMEEDTAKSQHTDDGTLIDFNKSGIPLIEVVTEPDFQTVDEVNTFAKRLKQIVQYTEVSNANMEKGQMRFELNLSLRKPGETSLPSYKVEVKNIGSISVLEKVIEYEIDRQSKILDKGEIPVQETRGLKDMTGETTSQRTKEGAADYRYFPEPDIPLLVFEDALIKEIQESIPELPVEIKNRYQSDYGLEPGTIDTIIRSKQRVDWFNRLISIAESKYSNKEDRNKIIKESAKWFIGDVFGLKQAHKVAFRDLPVTQEDVLDIVEMIDSRQISGSIAKNVLEVIFSDGGNVSDIIESRNLKLVSDSSKIDAVAKKVINDNPKVVEDYKKNPNAVKFLVGQVMKEMRGKADARVAEESLVKQLNN